MTHDTEQSDGVIVAMKAANKGARAPAESLEQRTPTKRNPQRTGTVRTQGRGAVTPGAERIRQFAKENPGEQLTALLHHITTETLEAAYLALKRDAAPGVDGMTWREYGDELAERLLGLKDRVHSGAYRAAPVRRVEIPKPDGGMRQLGIASLEDKIVQRAVVEQILNPIYESEFYGFNYGFRPGRSAHNALDALAYAVERRKVSWVVEVDIRQYFDSIEREQLMQFLEMRIGDRRVLRLIRKWLNAGVIDAGLEVDVVRGTPQGAVISPLLANVYLHHVLDGWFAREWRPREARGEVYIVRYADDFVLGFEYRSDAERFMEAMRERFAAFRAGSARGEDAPVGVWQVRNGEPCEAWGRPTGDVRLSGLHALLPDDAKRGFRTRAQAGSEASAPHAQGGESRLEEAYARAAGDDGDMAWAGATWVAWLLRSTDQLPGVTPVRTRLEAALAACSP